MARDARFTLRFHRTARGACEIREFLRDLPSKNRRKCYTYLDRLRRHGTKLPRNYVEKISDNLWEVKPEFGGIEYRFFVGIVAPGVFGVVKALKKKEQRLPTTVFEHARRLIEEMKDQLQ